MNKDRSNILDSFYNGSDSKKEKRTTSTANNSEPNKVVTYSLKEANVRYIELRATHFNSKSALINHLIEEDMKLHPEIVEMTKALTAMK